MTVKTCSCHTSSMAVCDYPGGCGSSGGCCTAERACRNGERCAGRTPHGPYLTPDPLCLPCLGRDRRDIAALDVDYLDLAQLHETSLSQAIVEKTSGSAESPMLLAGHVEALQAEIVHVALTWEAELRAVCHLPGPETLAPLADWHTTVSKPRPIARLRPAAALQRALRVIVPRVERLSKLPATPVCPTGVEDPFTDVEGWQAVQHLASLHGRARGFLGRTTRKFWIPGECWTCDARPTPGVDGPLWRSEPTFAHPGTDGARDPMQVNCSKCAAARPYPDYETYTATLFWPELQAAA